MAVGFKVKYYWYQIGSGDFIHSFFSTICLRLEDGKWGCKYPYLMNELYQGKLSKKDIDGALYELKEIQKCFESLPTTEVVWDIDNLEITPPWGDNISSDIKDLSTYYVTSEGEDLITLLEKALKKAKALQDDLLIESI